MQLSPTITPRQIATISGLCLFVRDSDLQTKVLIASQGRCSRVEDLTRDEGFILLKSLTQDNEKKYT